MSFLARTAEFKFGCQPRCGDLNGEPRIITCDSPLKRTDPYGRRPRHTTPPPTGVPSRNCSMRLRGRRNCDPRNPGRRDSVAFRLRGSSRTANLADEGTSSPRTCTSYASCCGDSSSGRRENRACRRLRTRARADTRRAFASGSAAWSSDGIGHDNASETSNSVGHRITRLRRVPG